MHALAARPRKRGGKCGEIAGDDADSARVAAGRTGQREAGAAASGDVLVARVVAAAAPAPDVDEHDPRPGAHPVQETEEETPEPQRVIASVLEHWLHFADTAGAEMETSYPRVPHLGFL